MVLKNIFNINIQKVMMCELTIRSLIVKFWIEILQE